MPTFRLNERPHRVPGGWGELSADQLVAVAPQLLRRADAEPPTPAQKLAALAVLATPAVPRRQLRRLAPDAVWDIAELFAWLWEPAPEADTSALRAFAHRGRRYRCPEASLADAVAIEYAMAIFYFHQFARPAKPVPAALDALVATLCRPVRPDLAAVQESPAWDGQAREPYNGKLATARALELADLPLATKVLVLHQFLAGQRFIHQSYAALFRDPNAGAAPGTAPARPAGAGTEMLELLAELAERGTYGTYEAVCNTGIHTILFNQAQQARRRRAAE